MATEKSRFGISDDRITSGKVMSDKRRKARVQGGWSSHGAASNARSDRHKPKIPDPPAWLTKNADITSVPKFVYEEVEVRASAAVWLNNPKYNNYTHFCIVLAGCIVL